jgi:modulator of FtsH protease HflK
MNGHEHHDHDHPHEAPETQDAGSQALAEALGSSFTIVKIVMGLMVVAFICSGFFQVGPQEKVVILRFGKLVGQGEKVLLGPGLHWSFPYPIDEVVRIPIAAIQTVTSDNGWYATTPEQELSGEELPAGPSLNPAVDGSVLTADTNIVHVRATLSYHVTDPIQYVFNFVSASNAVQNALDNAVLYSAAQFNADDILINDVERYREAVQDHVSDLIEQDNLGIAIDQCTIDKTPPRQLKDIFDQVIDARQKRAEALNEAHNYENQVTNNASAAAANIINLAQSAKFNYVTNLVAEAKRFSDILPYYQTNSALYVQQTFVQTIGPALTNVQDKWFLPVHPDGKPYELRLMLNRALPQPPAQSPPTGP